MRTPERWDVFCRVVDYLGDAGVAWRLSRQLVHEHGVRIRLWIDDLSTLQRLHPAISSVERQFVEGIEVCRWPEPSEHARPAEVVIDAFGCGLPEDYVEAMAQTDPRPLWIVLEYLSAEAWVREHHGLPSPHPRLPLSRYFFFPGFSEGTGGLLRERDLFSRRDAFDAARRLAFWSSVGHVLPPADSMTVSVFSYETAPLAELLECWENGRQNIVAIVPEGPMVGAVLGYWQAERVPASRVLKRARLEVRIVPFVPQARYDELLWSCDCNFVRGEDSFVRAQWAARPLVWQAYRQQERAHWSKLDAFIDLYCDSLSDGARAAVTDLTHLWNQAGQSSVSLRQAWDGFAAHWGELVSHARKWAGRAARAGSLADNLAAFCRDKLK